jgi:hypothetical protein
VGKRAGDDRPTLISLKGFGAGREDGCRGTNTTADNDPIMLEANFAAWFSAQADYIMRRYRCQLSMQRGIGQSPDGCCRQRTGDSLAVRGLAALGEGRQGPGPAVVRSRNQAGWVTAKDCRQAGQPL